MADCMFAWGGAPVHLFARLCPGSRAHLPLPVIVRCFVPQLGLAARFGPALFLGFVLGTLYYQQAHDQLGAQNRVSMVFLSINFAIFGGA